MQISDTELKDLFAQSISAPKNRVFPPGNAFDRQRKLDEQMDLSGKTVTANFDLLTRTLFDASTGSADSLHTLVTLFSEGPFSSTTAQEVPGFEPEIDHPLKGSW